MCLSKSFILSITDSISDKFLIKAMILFAEKLNRKNEQKDLMFSDL